MTITESKAPIGHSIEKYVEYVSDYSKSLSHANSNEELSHLIENDFKKLCLNFIEIADQEHRSSEEAQGLKTDATYIFNFRFPEYFKSLALVHRDILLQLQIARIRANEGLVDLAKIEDHNIQCKKGLIAAVKEVQDRNTQEQIHLFNENQGKKSISDRIQHQQNPWLLYKKQFEKILDQINQIQRSNGPLLRLSTNFDIIKETVNRVGANHQQFNADLIARISSILKNLESGELDKLGSKIEDALEGLEKMGNRQGDFTEELDQNLDLLDKISIAVDSEEGYLKIREVPVQRKLQKWFDFVILPLFMDVIGQENAARTRYQVGLTNLRSGVQLLKSQERTPDSSHLVTAVNQLVDSLKVLGQRGAEISGRMADETRSRLRVSNLFENEPFLEVPLNAAISTTLDLGRNTLIEKIRLKYRQLRAYFDAKYKDSEYRESFSEIELTTQCIAHRMLKEENEHYDTLFLTKNFIGDLFLVSREQQEKKFQEALTQWKNGFPKAVLVSGDRLSGRSTFANYVAKKYFGKDIVVLSPKSTSTIDGRKFSTTCDLKDALQFVKNHNTKSTAPVIVIDDLELWRDSSHSLLNNIRALIDFTENETDDALVLAVCTNALKNHLDKRLNFSNVFSTLIDTSSSSKNEILEAILLRHGAGHRTLISENGEEILQHKITSLASNLSKKYNYNMGEVLQAWTYNTFVQDGQQVLFKPGEPEFLDFFSNEELMVLKQTSLFKWTSEYGLRQLNPQGFETRMKSGVKRLINTKILLRDPLGNLSINPVALYDVSQILKRKKYINT
ncbi:MAG: ATP-binding protein [Bacteroidia bacterium]|nr:ATP-binding protein [Bacteroidia bacterium]